MTKRKEKKNNKRRLLLLILLLVCALVLLGGATYAWFTSNTKVTIQAMDLEVQVANGIEISADAKNWGAKINLLDLYKAAGMKASETTNKTEDAGSINQFPEKLKNVSTVGNINLGTEETPGNNRLELFNGKVTNACDVPNPDYKSETETPGVSPTITKGVQSDDYNVEGAIDISECGNSKVKLALVETKPYVEGTEACAEKEGVSCTGGQGVYAFDIYLKLDNKSTVSLAGGSYVKNTTKTDYGLKNTIRVAFVTLGTQPADFYYANDEIIDENGKVKDYDKTGEKDYQENYATQFGGYAGVYGARQMDAFGTIHIWEPNATQHTTGGIKNAFDNYDISVENGSGNVAYGIYKDITGDTEEGAKKLPMYLNDTVKADKTSKWFAQQKENNKGGAYKNDVAYKTSPEETTESIPLFTAPAGVTKVRVYIWVEGQDIDTENNATASKIQTLLSFTTAGVDSEDISKADFEQYTNPITHVWRNGTPNKVKQHYVPGSTSTETATETGTGAGA